MVPLRHNEDVTFEYHVKVTMMDAAMLDYLTENISHQRCGFCLLLPREFILVEDGDFNIHELALDCCCLSILHFGLRSLDHVLKLGMHQEFKQPRCSRPFKELFEEAKRRIQDACIDEKNGLRVCFPSKKGGSSNTGRTARYDRD